MPMPDPVHDDARGERIIRRGDRLSQFTSPATVGVERRRFTGEDLNEAAGDQLALLPQVAVQGDVHIIFAGILKDVCNPVFFRGRFFQLLQFGAHFDDLLFGPFFECFFDVLALDLEPLGLVVQESIDRVILIFDRLLSALKRIDDSLRDNRVFAIAGVLKNPCDGVVVLRRDRVEFVIVTSCASGCQTEEGSGEGIDSIGKRLGLCLCFRFRVTAVGGVAWPTTKNPVAIGSGSFSRTSPAIWRATNSS